MQAMVTEHLDEIRRFVERALTDFGLLDEFEHQPSRDRAECLEWIAGAPDSNEVEERVSRLLDALAIRGRLLSMDG